MFARVLIANRGEIAVRVLADAAPPRDRGRRRLQRRRRGRAARARRRPGGAARAGARGASPTSSIERVVAAALETGAEAVHPGLRLPLRAPGVRARLRRGRPDLRRARRPRRWRCSATRSAAKQAAADGGRAGRPGAPRRRARATTRSSTGRARRSSRCCVKAAAGGGGKGMRVVRSLDELPEALGAARREARAAFGDDRLLVERYVERPRHIEVQVLADAHGTRPAPRRARVQPPAPPPEGDRGGALAGRRRGAARAAGRGGGRARARAAATPTPARSSSSPSATTRRSSSSSR